MNTRRRVALLAGWWIAALIFLLFGQVPPTHAAPLCKQWRIGPYFRAVQENGYTVLFQLKQYAHGKLAGNASYVSKGKTMRGSVLGGVGDTVFKARVEWNNGTIGNYTGSPWFVKPMGKGLSANMRGNAFQEGAASGSAWRTNAATGESQPIHCDPEDTIRQ